MKWEGYGEEKEIRGGEKKAGDSKRRTGESREGRDGRKEVVWEG